MSSIKEGGERAAFYVLFVYIYTAVYNSGSMYSSNFINAQLPFPTLRTKKEDHIFRDNGFFFSTGLYTFLWLGFSPPSLSLSLSLFI